MIAAYYKLSILSDDLKAANKIKVGAKTPRYDCIEFIGAYEGINPFVNPKGMFKLSYADSNDVVNTDKRRVGEFALVGGKSLTFSSLYSIEGSNFYYGYPNGKPFLKDGRQNPLIQYRNDLYVFVIDKDFAQIELLVLPNQKGYALELFQSFTEGDFDDDLEKLKNNSNTFFSYGCL